jgi:hypothetical protein
MLNDGTPIAKEHRFLTLGNSRLDIQYSIVDCEEIEAQS